ncbi:MAG: M20/M25/M40 family metallo-hydrolase [Candidatus Woesebacteria bacterium]|nr:M20/M25/M40 family metallo-hydrolase [Candidatus Woesebacteria bacterium]
MQNKIIGLLTKLTKIPSSYPKEKKISTFLESELKSRGFKITKQKVSEDRYNIFAEKGIGAKPILFYGHMDTVSIHDSKKWKTDPFTLKINGDNAYGLGVSDMKSGISAFIEAATDTSTPVKIFLAIDEENISEGSWSAIKSNRRFFNDVELIISAEPSFGLGLNSITRERTGRCIYEIKFIGKTKHIIRYKEAVDAIQKLCNFGYKFYSKRDKLFKSKDTVAQLRLVKAESNGMSVCGEAKAEVEVMLGSTDSIVSVRKQLQTLTNDKVEIKSRKTPYLEGYAFKVFPYEKIISKIIKNNTEKEMKLYARKSVGDDNVLATLKIPVITWGTEGGNEHTANEFVKISSLLTLTKMYKELLNKIGEINRK